MTGLADISSAPLKEADATPSFPPPPPPDVFAPPPPPITGPYIPAYVANNPLALHLQALPTSANANANGFGVGGFSGAPPPPPQTLPPLAPPASFLSNGIGPVPGGPSFLPNVGAAANGAQPLPHPVPLVRPVPPPMASKPTGLRPVPVQGDSSAFTPQPPPAFGERPARQQQLPYEREMTFRLEIRLLDGSTTYGFRLRGGAEFNSKVFILILRTCINLFVGSMIC